MYVFLLCAGKVKDIVCKTPESPWLFAVQQIKWMFLGLLLAQVVANIPLYLCRGKCVSSVSANDILMLPS